MNWANWVERAGVRRSFRATLGFTLLELLTAITITALLVGFSVTVVANVSGLWKRAAGRVSTEAQARHILDQLEADLSGALFREDGRTWLAASTLRTTSNSGLWDSSDQAAARGKPESNSAGFSYDVTTANLADARCGVAGVWLRFLTTARGTNDEAVPLSVSAPVAVGYQIIRRTLSASAAVGAPRRYLLHRAQVRPSTSAEGAGVVESGYDVSAYDHLHAPSREQIVGDNVIDFGVRLYCQETLADGSRRLRLIFPASGTGELNVTDVEHTANLPAHATDAGTSGEHFPAVVDVMIRILSDEGATVIAGYEARAQRNFAPVGVSAAEHWWNLAMAHSRVYTRRIVVRSQQL